MAARMVMLVIASDMGSQEPAHVSAQVAIVEGPERQVKMVGQQAPGQQAHRNAFACLVEQCAKGGEVAVFVKDGLASIASVEDMVTEPTLGSTESARHVTEDRGAAREEQGKSGKGVWLPAPP